MVKIDGFYTVSVRDLIQFLKKYEDYYVGQGCGVSGHNFNWDFDLLEVDDIEKVVRFTWSS